MITAINASVEYIQANINGFVPQHGIVLGTGLGGLIDHLEIEYTLPYEEIPHFVTSTVEMHKGNLIFGKLAGKNVVVMQGRFHYYEGYSMQEVTFPIRVMKVLGIATLLLSNAAGGINSSFEISDLMIINDHINLQPENPLTGKNVDELGGRFPDMSEPYDFGIIEKAKSVAQSENIDVKEGVYVSVPGPNLETRAEYKFLGIIGADAVGMSTVPEVIVARQMDLPVFAVSVITDLCYPGKIKKVELSEIIKAAAAAEPKLVQLISALMKNL